MDANNHRSPIGELPLEMFRHVCSFLNRRDRLSLAYTNKSFGHVIIGDLWDEDIAGANDALFFGCLNGRFSIVQHAIANGAPVRTATRPFRDFTDTFDNMQLRFTLQGHITPLGSVLSARGPASIIELLLRSGVDADETGIPGSGSILLAIQSGYRTPWCPRPVIELLREYGATVPDSGTGVLRRCLYLFDHQEWYCPDPVCVIAVMDTLLRGGADPSEISCEGKSILNHAIERSSSSVVKLLLDRVNRPNIHGSIAPSGCTLLRDLIWRYELEADTQKAEQLFLIFSILLEAGADADGKDGHGQDCPLVKVCRSGIQNKRPFIGLLISHGANVNNSRSPPFYTPLTAALDSYVVKGRGAEAIECLLENGADPNLADREGIVPYRHAAQHNLRDMMELLVMYGASP